jgi:hypothetical protein
MTTVIRRKRALRSSIGPYKRHELLTGWIVYPVLAVPDTTTASAPISRRSSLIRREPTGKPTARSCGRSGGRDKTEADVFRRAPVAVRGWQRRHPSVGSASV